MERHYLNFLNYSFTLKQSYRTTITSIFGKAVVTERHHSSSVVTIHCILVPTPRLFLRLSEFSRPNNEGKYAWL